MYRKAGGWPNKWNSPLRGKLCVYEREEGVEFTYIDMGFALFSYRMWAQALGFLHRLLPFGRGLGENDFEHYN